MKRTPPQGQLSLWEQAPAPDDEQAAALPLQPAALPNHPSQDGYTTSEIAEMQAYILAWGARNNYPSFSFPFCYPPKDTDEDRRFGLMYRTRAGYTRELAKHMQRARFPGEWEAKCIEQLHRFDSGVSDKVWLWLPDVGCFPADRPFRDDDE